VNTPRLLASLAALGIVGGAAAVAVNRDGGNTASPPPTSQLPRIPFSPSSGGVGADKMSSEAAASDRMAFWAPPKLILDNPVTLPATAPVYRWNAASHPSQERVAEIAKLLGVEGAPTLVDGQWTVGTYEAGKVLNVNPGGDGSWWFNNSGPVTEAPPCAYAQTEPFVGEGDVDPAAPASTDTQGALDVPVDPSTDPAAIPTDVAPCPEPTPPANLPSDADALSAANKFLAEINVPHGKVSVTRNDWSVDVMSPMLVDGNEILGSTFTFSFQDNGVMSWAGGPSSLPTKVGDYPLVAGDKAFQRLVDQQNSFAPMIRGELAQIGATIDPAVDPTPATTITVPAIDCSDPAVTCAAPGTFVPGQCGDPAVLCAAPGIVGDEDPCAVDAANCAPLLPIPPAEQQELHITGGSIVWQPFWTETDVWLVPHVDFIGTDGSHWQVIAVSEELLTEFIPPAATPVEPPASPEVPELSVAPQATLPTDSTTTVPAVEGESTEQTRETTMPEVVTTLADVDNAAPSTATEPTATEPTATESAVTSTP
jgi:hypothetical protein